MGCLDQAARFKSWNQSSTLKSDGLKDYFSILGITMNYLLLFNFLLNSSIRDTK